MKAGIGMHATTDKYKGMHAIIDKYKGMHATIDKYKGMHATQDKYKYMHANQHATLDMSPCHHRHHEKWHACHHRLRLHATLDINRVV